MIRMITGAEYAPVEMSWAHPFRRSTAGLAGFNLGNGSSAAISEALGELQPLFEQLDHVEAAINGLANQAVTDPGLIRAFHDALGNSRDRAVALQTQLDSTGATEAWHASVRMLGHDISAFQLQVSIAVQAAPAQRALSVGIWVGVAVAGAIGAGFLIRHYGKRGGRG